MADRSDKVPENVAGKWYVDRSCTLCDVCIDAAPSLLRYHEDRTHVFFAKQPQTPAEVRQAEAARDVCPSGSIGDDGDLA